MLLSLSHSREQERDADAFGVALADAAGFDPAGLKQFFEALGDHAHEGNDWFSTHPNTAERIQAIDAFIKNR